MAFRFLNIFKDKARDADLPAEMAGRFVEAQMLRDSGQPRQAADLYRTIIEAHPEHWASVHAAAAIMLEGGDGHGAEQLYGAFIDRVTDHAEAHYRRGNLRNGGGTWEAALADYDRAVALDPRYAVAYCNRGAVLERMGRWDAALGSYERALALDPDDPLAHYNRGAVLKELGRFEDALSSYDRAISLRAEFADAYTNRGNVLLAMHRYDAAIASYDTALELAPSGITAHFSHHARGMALAELTRHEAALSDYDEAIRLDASRFAVHASRAMSLRKVKRLDEALMAYERAIALRGGYAEGYYYRGQILHELRRFEEAIASFDQAAALTPANLSAYLAHSGRGFALAALKRFDEALASFAQSVLINPGYVEGHCSQGHILQELQRYAEAAVSYSKAAKLDPAGPQAFAACRSLGFVLKEIKHLEEALASFDAAIRLKDDDFEAHMNRGGVLQELGRHEDALASFDRALVLEPDSVEACQGRGFSLLNRGHHQLAIAAFDRAIALNPDQKYMQGFRRYVQMQICDWRGIPKYLETLERDLEARKPVSAPFQVLALVDSPRLHRLAAEIWVNEEAPPDDALGPFGPREPGGRIRIGYFSADFRNHPVALLTADLFERHNREKFEVIGFALGPTVRDAMRARLEVAFDRLIDVSEMSDLQVADGARKLNLDIAIDLGGFTEFARPRIFALRAAPVQISYVGYLGTMGASYMDYLLADTTIVPGHMRQFYAEKIIYLPSYQVNDSKRQPAGTALTREELGLPSSGFLFSCFNANYKITPTTFSAWMRILRSAQSAYLFLYAGNDSAEDNLRDEARRAGVDPRRIVFGKYLAQERYLARFRTMDLFLDTLPYNAGTTASDALWAGLPVLTCTGDGFAGRVAASLLTALELPELVVSSVGQYEEMAVQLAENPERLALLRQKLAKNRYKTALFDTRSFTRHLESAYEIAQQRNAAGLAPDTITVSAPVRSTYIDE